MMLIQVPGCVMFVGSLVGRPGVEWSAWLTYAFAGSMQAVLLVSLGGEIGRRRSSTQSTLGIRCLVHVLDFQGETAKAGSR